MWISVLFLPLPKSMSCGSTTKIGNSVYLNIKERPKSDSEDRPHKKPTLLAIEAWMCWVRLGWMASLLQWELRAFTTDKRPVSLFASNLQQLDNGIQVTPTGWKCAKCDKVDNLWLNLTDGMILCGRRNWDGTGGNNHALEHYQETKYPLAVKLGTTTADLESAASCENG